MSKDSLLEVGFDHIAWTEVDPAITSDLINCIKPIEMGRGKHDVYLRCTWDFNTPQKIQEGIAFRQVFQELDSTNKVGGVLDAFFGKMPNDFLKVNRGSKSKSDTLGMSRFNKPKEDNRDIDLDQKPEKSAIDDIEEFLGTQDDMDEIEEYDPSMFNVDSSNDYQSIYDGEKTNIEENVPEIETASLSAGNTDGINNGDTKKFYVVDPDSKVIDSGWMNKTLAENRLKYLEVVEDQNMVVMKYGKELLKVVGDPDTVQWKPFGLKLAYVINRKRGEVDSAYDTFEEAEKRVDEINSSIKKISEDPDISQVISTSDIVIMTSEDALDEYGLSVTFSNLYVDITKVVEKISKEYDKKLELKNKSDELDSVLTESTTEKKEFDITSILPFYLVFNFTESFNPDSDEGRRMTRQNINKEYSEIEISLKSIVSGDGDIVIPSKNFLKACEKSDTLLPYQLTVQMINHTADYYYHTLNFAGIKKNNIEKEVDRVADDSYNPRQDALDDGFGTMGNVAPSGYNDGQSIASNSNAKINTDYASTFHDGIENASNLNAMVERLIKLIKNEDEGLAPADEEQLKENGQYVKIIANKIIDTHKDGHGLALKNFEDYLVPMLEDKAIAPKLFALLEKAIDEDKRNIEAKANEGKGTRIANNAFSNVAVNEDKLSTNDGYFGVGWNAIPELSKAKSDMQSLLGSAEYMNAVKGKSNSERRKIRDSLFNTKYNYNFKDVMNKWKGQLANRKIGEQGTQGKIGR